MAEPLQFRDIVVNSDGTPTERFRRLWQTMFRQPVFTLASTQEPPAKGQLVVAATSDTSLTFRYRGADGVVRSGSITLI